MLNLIKKLFPIKNNSNSKHDIYYHPVYGLANTILDAVINPYSHYNHLDILYSNSRIIYRDNYGFIELFHFNNTGLFLITDFWKNGTIYSGNFYDKEKAKEFIINCLNMRENYNSSLIVKDNKILRSY